jgi:hypothetical protein
MSNSRTKLKQADWPLCSKSNVEQTLEQKTRKKSHPKLSVLPIRSSGKCKIQKQNISKIHPSEKHVCDTCKEEIPDISRVLLMRDMDGGPRLLCFHYFSPCWSMELLCQQYPNFVIERAGFSIPENVPIKEDSLIEMQSGLDYWN